MDAQTLAGDLVGRERELDEMLAGLRDAAAGRGSLFLISGEPGVGKTRLADAAASHAEDEGALLLWGRCWEGGGAPAYWPWVQVLRTLARGGALDDLAERMAAAAPHVARLIPELRDRIADLPDDAPDADDARFAFFDAVTMALREAARERLLVIVLDDLQAADEPSLHLLEFLAHELRGARILVIGTYRALDGTPRARELLGRLARDAKVLPLSGLAVSALEQLVAARTGAAPAPGLVQTLHEATGGNPFFADEVVRLLASQGESGTAGALPLPDGVREAIRARLAPLRPETMAVLQVAAGLGKEFTLVPLELGCELPRDRVLDLLEDARTRGIVVQLPGEGDGYRFAHALVREVLYDDLTPIARNDLHQRIGRALESLYGEDPEPHLAELAHHFLRAAPTDYLGKAIEYAGQAGERAMAVLAWEEAAEHFERALRALAKREHADPRRRADLLLSLGLAWRRAGDVPAARKAYERAGEIGDQLGARELVAEAALGFAGRYWTAGVVDPTIVAVLERALSVLGDGDSPLRARLLGRLATEHYYDLDRSRAAALSEEAVAMARRIGEEAVLAAVLDDRLAAVWGPENLEERLALATEIVGLAERVGDRETALRGRAFRVTCLIELGDITQADAEIALASRQAEALRQPLLRWHTRLLRGLRALSEGRWEDAERLAALAFEAGQRADSRNAALFNGIQRIHAAIHRQRGLEKAEAAVRAFVEEYPALPAWRLVLAYTYVRLGRVDDARVQLEAAGANDWRDLPNDSSWLVGVSIAADVCGSLRHRGVAPGLYALLEPYADRLVVLGRVASLCVGSAQRYLGLLAHVMGDLDRAAEHFEAALAVNGRTRMALWLAYTERDYAALLRERGAPGDAQRAAELHAHAGRCGQALEMPGFAVPIEEPAVAPSPRAERAVLRRQGDYWEVGFAGGLHMLRDVKGLGYIAELLRHPGSELAASELVAAGEPTPATATGHAGELLDPAAKQAYRARIEDLRDTIEEAERFGDPERAAAAREEMAFIAQELSAAVGLGGRDRRAASDSERARINVTRAIKSAVQRIAETEPGLARHLETGIRTGTFCSYQPDPLAPLSWTL